MITKLTPEQEALLPIYRDRWLKIGLSTKAADKKQAELDATAAYQIAGLNPPKNFAWFESPLSMIIGKKILASAKNSVWDSDWNSVGNSVGNSVRNSVWDSVGDSVRNSVWDSVGDSVWNSVGDSVRNSVWDSVGNSVWGCLFGSQDAHWLGFYCYFHDVLKINGVQKIQPLANLAVNCGWWMPYKHICLMSELPTVCDLQDGAIHSLHGPAIAYRDGFAIWAINGVVVDEQIVMAPEAQTLEQIRADNNEERRRIRIDRYGWQRYLSEANATVLDVNVPSAGWMESLMRSDDGMAVLCTYDPSTGRIYALEVDPKCKTCEQAQRYLLAPEEATNGLGLTPKNVQTYPTLRT